MACVVVYRVAGTLCTMSNFFMSEKKKFLSDSEPDLMFIDRIHKNAARNDELMIKTTARVCNI